MTGGVAFVFADNWGQITIIWREERMPETDDERESMVLHLFAGVVGAMLLVLAVMMAMVAPLPELPYWAYLLLVIALGLLGVEALVSAFTGHRSLLSRIGQLP